MHIAKYLWALAVVGCAPVESSDGWVPPTTAYERAQPVTVPSEVDASEDSEQDPDDDEDMMSADDVEEDVASEDAGSDEELTDEQLLARSLGLEIPTEPEAADAAPVDEAAADDAAPQLAGADVATSGTAVDAAPELAAPSLAASTWGVRLVAIMPGTQPPRAVLGLASGEEVVVEPGSFVDAARVVVMAVGTDAVQVAYVEPHGDSTRVRTETLVPLHRGAPVAGSEMRASTP